MLILPYKNYKTFWRFLERAQLTGKEAFVYVQLVTKLMAELNKTRPYPSSVEEPSPVM